MQNFVHLHTHTQYSLLDGLSKVKGLIEYAKKQEQKSMAITDHGVMYGAIELLKLCGKAGIKPIIGNEMYVINGSIEDPQPKKERRYHLVVLAKNAVGYRNLVKLTSISHLRGMRGRGIFARACIDKQLLRQYSEGLIVSTACLGGEIPQAILKGRPDVARSVAAWYQEVFGADFYLEIQDHGGIEDRIVNVEMARIGAELGIPLIATNDDHYLSVGDVEAHDALLCVLTGKLITDEKRLRYTGTEYIRSEDELFAKLPIGALSLAGGTTSYAALNDIVILRRENGSVQEAIRFRYPEVERGKDLSQNILLRSGDTVVVP
jgi:DNA polymerase-3 subunit alpha